CAHHGCVIPHSVVDFQKGERQMNIDYFICQVLLYNTEGLQFMDVCYDVACQWWIHFLEHVADSKYLKVADKIKIIAYVEKFHLRAHITECFAKFSLNFVKDMGEIEGEVVKMLWSKMNGTGPSTRAMTKAHRQEVLNDHFKTGTG
ncbi:hypothetical protein BKA93DRAFT_733881, partial [Sparassis latifolia]